MLASYIRVGNENLKDLMKGKTTCSGNEGWSLDMLEEPCMWTHTAQELMDNYYYKDKISKSLGDEYFVKKGKLFRK